MNRRKFFQKSSALGGASLLSGLLLYSCNSGAEKSEPKSPANSNAADGQKKGNSTSDDPNDLAKRKQLGYVESTPIAENHCSNCGLYLAPKEGQTEGGCQLFKGTVKENGYCTYWAPAQQK